MAKKVVLKNVSFTYLHSEIPALKNINLEIEQGTVTAIVGPVGAGKSTLLMTLNAIVPEHLVGDFEGHVLIDGLDTIEHSTEALASHIGLVFDDPALQITNLTVEEDVAFGPVNLGLERSEIWKRVGIALSQTRLSGYEKRNPRQLSGGEMQRLALAGIIAMRPGVLALDEPVSMLDPIGKEQVLQVIRDLNKEYGLTVLISDSGADIESVCDFADKMVLLHKGEVLSVGSPSEVLSDRKLVEKTKCGIPEVTQLFWALSNGQDILPPTKLEDTFDRLKTALLNNNLRIVSRPDQIDESKNINENEEVIIAKNIHHTYPGDPPVHALQGIDLNIRKGEMIALLGQNGSGKTTLAYHLAGILKPTNPDAIINVDGLDMITSPLTETIDKINYIFQNPSNQLFCETFGDEVAYGPKQLGWSDEEVEKSVQRSLAAVGLEGLRDEYVVNLTLSEETLLGMASVLSLQPEIIIADEPTGGLDRVSAEKVMELLQSMCCEDRTVIYITHDMKLVARYASRAVVLHKGKILIDGPPREVFSQVKVLERTKLFPPQITRLSQQLGEYGVPTNLLTIEEFIRATEGTV